MEQNANRTRREFIKKSAYAAPVVLSFTAIPSLAQTGSPPVTDIKGNNGLGQRVDDPQPPGMPPENDKPTSIPGNPNNRN